MSGAVRAGGDGGVKGAVKRHPIVLAITGASGAPYAVRLLQLLVELNRMGKTIVIATHDMNLIRQAKAQVQTRVLRIAKHRVQLAGADL